MSSWSFVLPDRSKFRPLPEKVVPLRNKIQQYRPSIPTKNRLTTVKKSRHKGFAGDTRNQSDCSTISKSLPQRSAPAERETPQAQLNEDVFYTEVYQ